MPQNILKTAPLITDNLNQICQDEFNKLQEILRANGVEFEIDPKLVRGLDYYSKSAFEFISDEIGSQSAVAGGGRYDKLCEYLDGKPTPAVGWAMGIERVMEILKQKESQNTRQGIYICALNPNLIDEIYKIAQTLRKRYITEISYEAKSPNKHLNIADKKGFEIFLCLGDDEFSQNQIWYKNLKNQDEKRISIANLESEI